MSPQEDKMTNDREETSLADGLATTTENLGYVAQQTAKLADLLKEEIVDRKALDAATSNLAHMIVRMDNDMATLARRVAALEAKVHEMDGNTQMDSQALSVQADAIRGLTTLVRIATNDIAKLKGEAK